MLARNAKPKLTLNVTVPTALGATTARPVLALKSPLTPLRSPMSLAPNSPTAYNTKMNQRGLTTLQTPTYAYANHSTSRSILKKSSSPASVRRQLQFSESPQIWSVDRIEDEGYYGGYQKMSRDERRWLPRS